MQVINIYYYLCTENKQRQQKTNFIGKMKTKHFLYLAMGALVTFSCTNAEDEGNGIDPVITPEYTNPTGFNYVTSRNVSLDINAPIASEVSVYTESDCKEEHLLVHNLKVSNSANPIEVNIPVACNTLYVKYPTASEPAIKSIPVSSLVRGREVISFTIPEDIVASTNEEDAGFTFYHNTGVAMFEDNWPNMPTSSIDADYNDVVLEYDFKVTECTDDSQLANHGYKEGLLITLDIRAIGGRYPNKVGVVLGQLDTKYTKDITARILLKGGQGKEKELAKGTKSAQINGFSFNKQSNCYAAVNVDTDHGSPVITFDGLATIRDNKNFFQTVDGYISTGDTENPYYMVRAEIKISGAASVSTLSKAERAEILKAYRDFITDTYRQNFFITTNNGKYKEIHMKGYKPTFGYTTYEADAAGFTMEGATYCSPSGYVWALKVPVGTKHAYERISFAEAYPKFENWKNTNGRDDQDWYKHPVEGKVVKYW